VRYVVGQTSRLRFPGGERSDLDKMATARSGPARSLQRNRRAYVASRNPFAAKIVQQYLDLALALIGHWPAYSITSDVRMIASGG
jgi:hypothetical protein